MSIEETTRRKTGRVWVGIGAGLAVWFAGAAGLGLSGLLTAPADEPFRPVLLSVIVPVATFVALYLTVPAVKRFVLSLDLARLTALQAWRVVGFAFLAVYAFGGLPGSLVCGLQSDVPACRQAGEV